MLRVELISKTIVLKALFEKCSCWVAGFVSEFILFVHAC